MSPDHRRIVEYPLSVHSHQAIPPLSSTRPGRITARALRLSTNKPTCARESHAHTRVGFVPRFLAVPTRHHSIFLATRKRCIWRNACTGTRGVDTERGGAHAFLCVFARPCVFVDAVECGELDHDGCGHGRCQLSGSHHHLSPFPLTNHTFVKSVPFTRYVP